MRVDILLASPTPEAALRTQPCDSKGLLRHLDRIQRERKQVRETERDREHCPAAVFIVG